MDDMVRRFNHDEDYNSLCLWLQGRGLLFPSQELLPKLGYICDNVGCGFMYVAEKKLGLFEWYVTNHEAAEGLRERALDAITAHLFADAKKMGLKIVIANTRVNRIKKLATQFNMKYVGEHSCFTKGF